MKVPTALFSGGRDTLADPKDIAVLLTQVSSLPPESRNRITILTLILLNPSTPPFFLCPPVRPQVSNLVFHQYIEHWEHVDFIWGLDAPDVMFPNILKLLKEHS